jgi:hypothetical protein
MAAKWSEITALQDPEALKSPLNQAGFQRMGQRQKILDLFEAENRDQHLRAEEIPLALAEKSASIMVGSMNSPTNKFSRSVPEKPCSMGFLW